MKCAGERRWDRTHLERDEPHALHRVADHEQVLDRAQGRDVHADVEEGYANEALVQVERAHVDLWPRAVRQWRGACPVKV